ncbi:hypothetical protein ABFA07_022004 [Porites harrisoni]
MLLFKAFGQITESYSRTFSVHNGDRLFLRCTQRELSRISPIERLIWFKDSVAIPASDPRLNSENGTLTIEQVRKSDAGTYRCELKTLDILSNSSTTINVIGMDPFNPSNVTYTVINISSSPPTTSYNKIASLQKEVNVNSSSPPPPTTLYNKIASLQKEVNVNSSSPPPPTTSYNKIASLQKEVNVISSSPPPPTTSYNKIASLQKEIDELLNANSSVNVSSFIKSLANATKSGNEITRTAKGLSASVKILVQLVNYNSLVNNSAVNTTTDQQNIVQVASNLLEEENTPTWLFLEESGSNVTDNLLKAMDDFGSQVGSQLDAGLDNSSNVTIYTRNIVFRVDLLKTAKKLSMDFSQHGAEIFVPGEVFASNSATKASTIVYKTLNNILTLKKEDAKNEEKNGKTKFKSGSNIVSATILPRPVSPMRKPIKFVFHHKNKSEDVIGSCVFWQIGLPQRTWLTRGCVRVEHESSARVTTCECDHLTVFAVLMNNKPVKIHHELYLKSIATIGCACSLLFLLLTFVLMAWLWKYLKSPRVKMILHLSIAIAATCILIMINENYHLEEVWCTVMAALLHYFLLCVFTWMFNHGVLLYLLIIKADLRDNIHSKMKWFYTFGWGFPCTVVGMSLIVIGVDKYVADNCWLTLEHNILYCAFVAPAAIIVLVNSVLFITLLCRINRVSKFRESMTRVQNVKAWLRRSLILLPVLGITWSFGLLTFISSTIVFHYLFTIFNSLQGFVIFFNFCVLDSEVRARVVGALCKKKHTSAGCVRNKAVAEPISIEDNVHKNNNLQAPAVIFLTAVPARIQGIENKRFFNTDENQLTLERQDPKLQTWKTKTYL